ncbi:hypothetical protein HZS_3504 [Henneguya salminicola]|nr:hypothetical protein HZS_3504 [Henneguya salminicola]
MNKLALSELNILSSSTCDNTSKPLVTIFGAHIPSKVEYPPEEIIKYLKSCFFRFINDFMQQISDKEYSILYFHDFNKRFDISNAKLLYHIHSLIEHFQRKNIMNLYIKSLVFI